MNSPICVGAFSPKNDYLWVTWSILLECNYSCRYCHVKSKGISNKSIIDKTISFLNSAPQKEKEVTLFGGEPTIHPLLFYIIENLYFCKKVHIFTNLSCSNNDLKKLVDNNISFSISYHSDIIKPEYFLNKLKTLLDFNGNIDFINVMMVDGKEKENEEVLSFCRDNKIKHRLLPIWQEGGKVNWIQSMIYSRRTDVIPIRDTIVVKQNKNKYILSEQECISLNMDKFKNYYCYAGVRSLYIDHNGNVYRCQADMRSNIKFCTVYDKYPLLKVYKCQHETCTCEYYIPKEIELGSCNEFFS